MIGQEYTCPSCEQTGIIDAAPIPQQPQQQPPTQQAVMGTPAGHPAQQQLQPQVNCATAAYRENAPGAVGSLVCGILSIFCCGIIFGTIAIALANQTRSAVALNPGLYTGEGMATAGRILGIIGLVLSAIVILINLATMGASCGTC
jgi:hypothetical protein